MAACDPRQPKDARRSLVRKHHPGVESDADLLGMVTQIVTELNSHSPGGRYRIPKRRGCTPTMVRVSGQNGVDAGRPLVGAEDEGAPTVSRD
jgi:hypothetical protein